MERRVEMVGEGEYKVGSYPAIKYIETETPIVGCTVVTMYDSQRRIGGIVHLFENTRVSRIDDYKERMFDEGAMTIEVNIWAKTFRSHCPEQSTKKLEEICDYLKDYANFVIPLDCYSRVVLNLENGAITRE